MTFLRKILTITLLLIAGIAGLALPNALYAEGGTPSPTLALRFDGAEGDHAGYNVAGADMNGDGYDDAIIGAWLASPVISSTLRDGAGAVYVVFGQATPYTTPISPATLGSNGFLIAGAAEGDNLGWSVANARDVNNDGKEDIIIGAILADPVGSGSGSAFVVFGKSDTNPVDLAVPGNWGFRIDGAADGDRAGYGVGATGDMNGDGLPELLVGAISTDFAGATSGSTYIVYGKSTTGTVNLAALGNGGWRIDGEATNHRFGSSVAGVPDLNGDGLPEILGGAYSASPNGSNSGSAFLVWGKATTDTVTLASLGNRGFAVRGGVAGDRIGISVASVGDQNGDGKAELLLGREENNAGAGGAVVIFGKSTTNTLTINALGNAGYRINGSSEDENLGYAVAGLGDTNQDGKADALIGGFDSSPNGLDGAGAAYTVFGQATTATIALSPTAGVAVRYDGLTAGERTGRGVGGADFNGDGVDDVILGADLAGAGVEGAVYVYLSPVAAQSVAITGDSTGDTNEALDFTATVAPLTTTTPITYQWSATNQNAITETGGITSQVGFTWSTPGTYTVTVVADNGYTIVSDSHTVTVIQPIIAPTSVEITGPVSVTIRDAVTYTASVAPISATVPITYSWQINNSPPIVVSDGLSHSLPLTWTAAGTFTITVSATNNAGQVSDSLVVVVNPAPTAVEVASFASTPEPFQKVTGYAFLGVALMVWRWSYRQNRKPHG